MAKNVLILPGDNIGPEIVAEAVKVLQRVDEKFSLGINLFFHTSNVPLIIFFLASLTNHK